MVPRGPDRSNQPNFKNMKYKELYIKSYAREKYICHHSFLSGAMGSRLPFPRRQNLDSTKLKVSADTNYKFPLKWQKVFQTGRKRAISPFPTVSLKDLYCRLVKNEGLCRKG